MTEQELIFKEFTTIEDQKRLLEQELEDCAHSYPIPTYDTVVQKTAVKHIVEKIIPMEYARGPINCVDIGTHVGAFCIVASQYFENIFSFEAAKNTHKLAKRNLKNFSNLKLFNHPVSLKLYNLAAGKDDDSYIKIASHESGMSRDASQYNVTNIPSQVVEKCKTISLEGIYKLCNIDYIDYLKIDCEGSEYDFLMGKDLSKINFMVMELHPGLIGESNASDLLQYLNKYFILNYRIGDDIYFYKSKNK